MIGSFNHYWSLAIEEQFYLVWPALIFLTPRRSLQRTLGLAIVISPVYLTAMTYFAKNPFAWWDTLSNTGYLAMGALVALLHHRGDMISAKHLARRSLMIGIALMLAASALDFTHRLLSLRGAFNLFGFGLIALFLVHRGAIGFRGIVGRFLSWPPLVYLGTISYGLYVYHGFMGNAMGMHFWPNGPVKLAAYLATTVPAAVLSWHLYEKPINDLKRFLPYTPIEPPSVHITGSLTPQVAAVPSLGESPTS
jgi:peptidoglycan/LPS O-acetylase OafA/YrhL